MDWRSIQTRLRTIFSFVFVLFVTLSWAQQGNNYSIDLSDLENYSSKKNIAMYSNHIEKLQAKEKAWYISEAIDVPHIAFNEGFVAISANLAFKALEGSVRLEYKVKNGKKWNSWTSFSEDDHHTGIVPKLYYLPEYIDLDVQQVQFRISSEAEGDFQLTQLDLRFYFPGNISTSPVKKKLGSGAKSVNCNCPLPNMEYRLDWCPSGNCPMDLTPSPTVVSHLVVHHSAGSNSSPDWAATVRSIWDYHVNNRGWDDIGYNFIIDPNGVIYEGRGNDVSGAHFSCMNPETMGVCLLGNYNTTGPTSAMVNSLTELLGWKVCDIDKDPRETSFFNTGSVDLINLCGHRDGNNIPASCTVTECPGNNVYAIMGNLRTAVYDYSQTCTLSPNYSNIVILDMGTTPQIVYEDETIDLDVVFKNSGDEDINETLNVDYQLDGTSIGSTSFSSLAINQTLSQSISHEFSSPGSYNFCAYIDPASNEFNTSNNSFCVNVEVLEKVDTSVTSIVDVENVAVKVYPNPANDELYIDCALTLSEIILYNALGQAVLQTTSNVLDLSILAPGVYTLRLYTTNGASLKSIKVLKK